jgi:hypothetical protein
MAKKRPPAELVRTVDGLNEMLERDPVAINWLVNFHAKCNDRLADHPRVQVRVNEDPEKGSYCSVGLLGVVNGLVCKPPFYVVAEFHDDRVARFAVREIP